MCYAPAHADRLGNGHTNIQKPSASLKKDPTVRGVVHLIEVTYRLSGRRWQRDEASEAKFFLLAEGLSSRRLAESGRDDAGPSDTLDPNDAFTEAGYNDVPF